jgi:hypothetical protein
VQTNTLQYKNAIRKTELLHAPKPMSIVVSTHASIIIWETANMDLVVIFRIQLKGKSQDQNHPKRPAKSFIIKTTVHWETDANILMI